MSIIVGFGYPMLMKSRFLSAKIPGTSEPIPIGFDLLQQGMEKIFKYKMHQEHSFKYVQISTELQNYPIDKLKRWAIDTIKVSELGHGEKNNKIQNVEQIMNGLIRPFQNYEDINVTYSLPITEEDKKQSLSGIIIGVGGISYAKKLLRN